MIEKSCTKWESPLLRKEAPFTPVDPKTHKCKTYKLMIQRTDSSIQLDGVNNVHIIADKNKIIIIFQCDKNTEPKVLPLMEML